MLLLRLLSKKDELSKYIPIVSLQANGSPGQARCRKKLEARRQKGRILNATSKTQEKGMHSKGKRMKRSKGTCWNWRKRQSRVNRVSESRGKRGKGPLRRQELSRSAEVLTTGSGCRLAGTQEPSGLGHWQLAFSYSTRIVAEWSPFLYATSSPSNACGVWK
jgi:hypothetical protein